jgi:long-chain acyl-CoA synthetase
VIGNPPSLAGFFSEWHRNKGAFLRYEGDLGFGGLTYGAAGAAALGFAEYLRKAGIRKGDKVVLWGENRPEWVVALWACLLEGVVATPIDFRSSGAVVERVAGIVEAKALLIGPGLSAPEGMACPVWPMRMVLETPRAAHAPAGAAEVDQLAEILFTSGATGEPKGVTITHRNILANLRPIAGGIEKYRKYMGPFRPIRFLNLLPLSHMFGQSMAALIPPLIAGEVYFTSGYSPRDVAHLVRRRRISVLVCVPQMLELLRGEVELRFPEAKEPRRSGKWYGSWWQYRRVHGWLGWKFWAFVVGAAPLDPELEEFWRRLGFVVIQGYGLTETAPVATLNHPFETKKGSVGKAIGGVEIRIAPDGEVLLRGENVTPGYYGAEAGAAGILDGEGWLHTGDLGELDAEKRLRILGRKKEVIIGGSGLNVYPEDVERVVNAVAGVRESAVVGRKAAGSASEEVFAVLVLEAGVGAAEVVEAANARLEVSQRIRGFAEWPGGSLPRTSGTGKLKRGEVAVWVNGGGAPKQAEGLEKYAGVSLENLSSLDRIQLVMELEKATGTRIDEGRLAGAKTVADLTRVSGAAGAAAAVAEEFEFPEWNRSWWARAVRYVALPLLILPLTRLFAWIRVEGLEHLRGLEGPVIFAANHQSHFDVPAIFWALPGRFRYWAAPAMSREFFGAWFHPERYSWGERFRSGLSYVLACLVFDAFPLPQRESGAREALRYAGELAAEGYSVVIFPEGVRTEAGEIRRFQPGVGMLGARLGIPVVPVRLEGLEKVLHKSAKMARPGRAVVRFGAPMRLEGEDFAGLAGKVEGAVRGL